MNMKIWSTIAGTTMKLFFSSPSSCLLLPYQSNRVSAYSLTRSTELRSRIQARRYKNDVPSSLSFVSSSSSSSLSSSSPFLSIRSSSSSSSTKIASAENGAEVTTLIDSNESIVKSRLEKQLAKKNAKKEKLEQDRKRNLYLKERGSTEMYAVKVSVDLKLRQELNLNGREKRGRVFIDMDNTGATQTMKGLKQEIHSFFRCLKKSSFVISAAMPTIVNNPEDQNQIQSVLFPSMNDVLHSNSTSFSEKEEKDILAEHNFYSIETDQDVNELFQNTSSFFQSVNGGSESIEAEDMILKRPSLLLHISKNPNAPKPPPLPSFLENMPDPSKTESMTMLSFYSFPNPQIEDPENFAYELKKIFGKFKALGRIYIAKEGVNAQMAVPTNILPNFMDCCMNHFVKELGEFMENGINIDPIPLTMEEFAVAGTTIEEDDPPCPPFKALHVRVRSQIVADGFSEPLDWQKAGYDMPPEEWHDVLSSAKEKIKSSPGTSSEIGNPDKDALISNDVPLLLDCRNQYETGVGRFDLAMPLNTTNFRDSWDVLSDQLKDVPKDYPIMTYCTGGIRCVKVGAYLTQSLNFTNVSRLAGGIIAYDRKINGVTDEKKEDDITSSDTTNTGTEKESLFKGTNYVFDGRVGRSITDDKLGDCVTCGVKTNLMSNCRNPSCHKRMVQCGTCKDDWKGCCSNACLQRVIKLEAQKKEREQIPLLNTGLHYDKVLNLNKADTELINDNDQEENQKEIDSVEQYAELYSSGLPAFFQEIDKNTQHFFPTGAHMVSGSTQGQFLSMLSSLLLGKTAETQILEVGTFSGYATASLCHGVMQNSYGENRKTTLISLERDARAVKLASQHLKIMESNGVGEKAAEAASLIRQGKDVDVFSTEDLQAGEYTTYHMSEVVDCKLAHVTDGLAFMEEMASSMETRGLNHASAESGETNNNNNMNIVSNACPFDMIFLDADKTRLLDYLAASINLLKPGGLIIVDNVLWKGLVVDLANTGEISSTSPASSQNEYEDKEEIKRSRRKRKLAGIMHRFNMAISQDDRLEVLMLPFRDGLSIIRKKSTT